MDSCIKESTGGMNGRHFNLSMQMQGQLIKLNRSLEVSCTMNMYNIVLVAQNPKQRMMTYRGGSLAKWTLTKRSAPGFWMSGAL